MASSVSALVDCGADVHILPWEYAMKMFLDVKPPALRVIGVNGTSSPAACQGSLVVQVQAPSGTCQRIDLGTAHAMKSCPTNLLSLNRLVDIGAVYTLKKAIFGFNRPLDSKIRGRVRVFL